MAYISLYRKYRSKTFDEIVGQEHITVTLKNAIERNRIGHAYLFSGPRGTGKTSTARIFAKALNCAEGPAPVPCNHCDICNAISTDSLFDVIEIDAASNRGIDDIRDLREKVRVPPSQARYKIYIIDEVHMLTKEAFNALLKTLEEPPSYVIFMMATTEPQKLLSTILSRCQRFDFRRLTDEEIGGHIRDIAARENFTIDDDALATVVKNADGSMRDSISILDQLVSFSSGNVSSNDVNQVFGLVERREISRFVNSVFEGDVSGTFEIFNSFFQAGKSFSLFIRYLMEYVRDLYFIKQKVRPSKDLYSDDELKPLMAQAKSAPASTLVSMLDEMARVEDRIRWETYPRIVLEIMVVKLLDLAGGARLLKDIQPVAEEPGELLALSKKSQIKDEEKLIEKDEKSKEQSSSPETEKVVKEKLKADIPEVEKNTATGMATAPPLPPDDEIPDPEPPRDISPIHKEKRKSEAPVEQMPPPDLDGDGAGEMVPQLGVEYPPVDDIAPDLEGVQDERLNKVRLAWRLVMDEIKKLNVPSYFHLANGVPAELAGNVLLLEFEPEHRFHMEQSKNEKNLEVLLSALNNVLGEKFMVRCRVRTDVLEGPSPASAAAAPPEVKVDEKREKKSAPRELSLFDTLTEVFPQSREIE